jgi:hypothetical protein
MIIDFPDAAAKLQVLARAEAEQRPSLSEYPERTDPAKIPLLAIDVEQHELEGRQATGIWCLNYGPLDEFSSEFMELATNLGKGLAGRPLAIDPLTFLLHSLSLFLWHAEDRQKADCRYFNLLTKPLPNGRSIQIRQIVSLIKAAELYTRQLAISATTGRPRIGLQESSAPRWQLVEEVNYTPGVQEYPKWVYQPDGRHRIVATREEHAGLFTEEWLNNGIVTTLDYADGPVNGAKGQGRLRSEGAIARSTESGSIAGGTAPKQEGLAGVQLAIECADRGGGSWQGIEILFLSDERVQVRNGTNTETHNYAELGFADRRVRHGKPKPNQAWMTLRAMAELNGIVRDGAKTHAAWPKVEKRMQEIRKRLREHFGITADPIPFVEGTGYQACFKIGCSPSFGT